MVVRFYTLEKPGKKGTKTKSVGRGGFGDAVGAIFGLADEPKKGKRIKDRGPVVQQVHKPAMSKVEVEEANVAEFQKLQARVTTIYDVMAAVEVNGTAVKQLKNMVTDLKGTIELFQAAFRAQHGRDVLPEEDVARVDEGVLAQHFLTYVLATRDPEPKQNQLAIHSKVSQSTWSRAFKEITFWQEVQKRSEVVWSAHSLVEKTIGRLRVLQVADKEIVIDRQDLEAIPDPFPVDVEFEADRKKYEKMGKTKLIREILKIVPSLRASDLEPKDILTLGKIYFAFRG
jgi:hypothetical protein